MVIFNRDWLLKSPVHKSVGMLTVTVRIGRLWRLQCKRMQNLYDIEQFQKPSHAVLSYFDMILYIPIPNYKLSKSQFLAFLGLFLEF